MTSNKSIVWKFFNVKATDAKIVFCNLCSNKFSREGSDEKVFSFDFNMSAVCLIKRVQLVNGFNSFQYGIHIFQFSLTKLFFFARKQQLNSIYF